MPALELYRWTITDPVSGKRRPTRYVMSCDDALALDPTAEPVPGTLEVRAVPDDPTAMGAAGQFTQVVYPPGSETLK